MPRSTEQLLSAAARGDAYAIGTLLAPRDAVNRVMPPLIAAAAYGRLEEFRTLLAAGADITADDGYATALLYAADRGYLAVVRELLAAGAAVDARTLDGSEETPLLCAAGSGHAPIVDALIAAGADVQARTDRGGSPLFLACQNGHTECVRALVRAGAEVSGGGRRACRGCVPASSRAARMLLRERLPQCRTLKNISLGSLLFSPARRSRFVTWPAAPSCTPLPWAASPPSSASCSRLEPRAC